CNCRGEVPFSMEVILPASEMILPFISLARQSIQWLPWEELKPRTGWLKTLNASTRNWPFTFSFILKFFNSERSERNSLGPENVFLPTLPNWPRVGRLKGPLEEPGVAKGPDGVKKKRPSAVLVTPVLKLPEKLGRHGPVSRSAPHSPYETVNGRPLPQVVILLS